MKQSYRADIDGLRAIAVLSVLFYHVDLGLFKGGYLGVDIFFVISGFLITRILREELAAGSFRFANFYERRVRRIFPSALFTLWFSLIGAAVLFSPADLVNFANSLMATLLFSANIYFWQHIGYFTGDAHVKPLLHMWSLSVEEQFYLIWPLMLAVFLRKQLARPLFAVMAVIGLLSIGAAVYLNNIDPNATFYLLPFRLFEFLIGGAVVWLIAYQPKKPIINELLTIAGIACMVIALTATIPVTAYPSLYTLVPCIGAALVIYAGAQTRSRWLLANRAAVYIGLISYQLYLIHWPIYVYYKYRLLQVLSETDKIIIVLASILIAIPVYHFIDKPLRKVGGTRALVWFAVITSLLTITVAGLAISMRADKGWPWRIDEKFRTLISDPGAFHRAQYGGIAYIQKNEPFTLGDPGVAPSFIIFGDSFAMQYASALDRLLKENHRSATALFHAICTVTPNTTPVARGPVDEDCATKFDKARALMEGNNLPIVVAHSWHTYKDIIANRARQKYIFTSDEHYTRFMIYELDQIRLTAGDQRRMVVIGVAPGMGDQQGVTRCFTMPTYIPNGCSDSVSLPASTMVAGVPFNTAAKAWAAPHPQITFLNPRDVVCDTEKCWAFKGTEMYYSDYIHFSGDGAWLFVNHFRDVFLGLQPAALPTSAPATSATATPGMPAPTAHIAPTAP